MQVDRQPSPWPCVAMLAGLLLLCLMAPRYWQNTVVLEDPAIGAQAEVASADLDHGQYRATNDNNSANQNLAGGLFDLLRRPEAEQQIRQGKTGRIVHALGFGAFLAKIHLLHFIPGNLRQVNGGFAFLADTAQHSLVKSSIRPPVARFHRSEQPASPPTHPGNAGTNQRHKSYRLAGHFSQGVVRRDQLFRQLPRFARADHPAVDFYHRHDFRARAR